LIAPAGAPGAVIRAVRDRRIEAVVSWELVEELLDVLARPKLSRYRIGPDDLESVLVLLAPALPLGDVVQVARDPDDAAVVAAAVAGNADAIVTGERDLLDDDGLRRWLSDRRIVLHTAAALVERLT
jgi:uncharacterized protein